MKSVNQIHIIVEEYLNTLINIEYHNRYIKFCVSVQDFVTVYNDYKIFCPNIVILLKILDNENFNTIWGSIHYLLLTDEQKLEYTMEYFS